MLAVGMDVGGTTIRAGVIDSDGRVLDAVKAPTPRSQNDLEDTIVRVVAELRSRRAKDGREISAVGLAVAGFVSADRQNVRFAPHLAWRDTPVTKRIGSRIELPIALEHDANAATVAEHRIGAASGSATVVLIAVGTGIGAGFISDGVLYRGKFGVAPELGHLRLVPGGRGCPCGKQGCWERYCSGTALAATAIELITAHPEEPTVLFNGSPERNLGAITGRDVAIAARQGDPIACRAMAELARWLGEGLALVADVYDPEIVVIAGGVSDSSELFLDAARHRYAEAVTGAGYRHLARIVPAKLGDDAAIIGAGLVALDGSDFR
jgi:glucokinase